MVNRTGLLATFTSGVLFGTSVPIIKLGLSLTPPFLFAALRFLLASILVLVILRRSGWVKMDLLRSRPMWTIGILNTAGYILQFEGQVYATASDAALIIGSAGLLIPIIARLRATEKLAWKTSLGVLSGFVGAGLVVTRGEARNLGQAQVVGDLLILGTAVTIALIFVFSKDRFSNSLLDHTPNRGNHKRRIISGNLSGPIQPVLGNRRFANNRGCCPSFPIFLEASIAEGRRAGFRSLLVSPTVGTGAGPLVH